MFYLLVTSSKLAGSSSIYADDVQLYTCFNPNDHVSVTSALNNLSSCIDVLKSWMQKNILKLKHLKCNMLPVSLNIG